MKRIIYLFITAALIFTACGGGTKGYKITGTVEGGADGDTVYLAEPTGRQLVPLDTAVIQNGKFMFEGAQDSAVIRYVTYGKGQNQLLMDFFLESGNIDLRLTRNNDSATGTPSNDIYQVAREKFNAATSEAEFKTAIEEEINKNINNNVGFHLLKNYNSALSYPQLEAIITQLPAQYTGDEFVVRLKDRIDRSKATAVGQKFVDLEMLTPDGKPIKLSDYAGKGKYVLVDFWASWCGPCRRDTPHLVEAYAKYKNKGFEIVGISFDNNGDSWKKGIKELNITWPQMSDLKYWQSEGAQVYVVNSIPHLMLIDKDGTIIARGIRSNEVDAKLNELLN